MNKNKNILLCNDEVIKENNIDEVRLIDEKGNMIGTMNKVLALEQTKKLGTDLVLISPNATPPVCKAVDYGKYKYKLQKKINTDKKKQKKVDIKEIRLKINIGQHDLEIKSKQALKFLTEGDKVKVVMRFKGREIENLDMAHEIMNKIIDFVQEKGKVDLKPKLEGRKLLMVIIPK